MLDLNKFFKHMEKNYSMEDHEKMKKKYNLEFDINNCFNINIDKKTKIKVKDFSDTDNIHLVETYIKRRNEALNLIESIYHEIGKIKLKEITNKEEEEQLIKKVQERTSQIYQIGFNIFRNVLLEDYFSTLYEYFSIKMFKEGDVVNSLFELLECIDIAIYVGLKIFNDLNQIDLTNIETIGNA